MADNYRHKYNNMSQIFFRLYIIRYNVDRIDLEWSIIYNKNTHNPPLEGIRDVLILTGIQDENADFLRQSALIICNYELFGKVFQGRMVRAGTADAASNPFFSFVLSTTHYPTSPLTDLLFWPSYFLNSNPPNAAQPSFTVLLRDYIRPQCECTSVCVNCASDVFSAASLPRTSARLVLNYICANRKQTNK